MSSTHTPQQPSPFDRLPNELLVKMLLHLPPPNISLDDDPPLVENDFFDVNLVSMRFDAFSRNLMWQRSIVDAESTPDGLLRAIAVVAKWPAIAHLGLELRLGNGLRPPRDWAVVLPGTARLVAEGFNRLDLVDLARFHNLRHVTLHDCELDLSSAGTVFPHLKSLRLSAVEVTGASPSAPVRTFPVLRHLAVVDACRPHISSFEPVFNHPLLARLDSLEVSVRTWHYRGRDRLFPLDDPPSSRPILWRILVSLADHLHNGDNMLSTSSVPFGQHLLLKYSHDSGSGVPISVHSERLYVELRRVVALHEPSRLRLVLVAGAEWRRAEATLPELAAIKALEQDCERRGIVLRSCERPWVEDDPVPEFLEFLREEKAARARS
ncbi:uncharacterized protein RHOBADRAFT_47008 [Rhodotorula graminis WP1]|uniref:F-box domain-containing protein n=1 Tax=Rhodotorula graminis (strain WP1) TaxID=578459 RepID=A0A0P9EFN0_RHOGW|nr:uncharacterized protein RHOBADRAFT_47008 [Rhodotorula graminis WP1]KPV72166.1 hypothetical protein RHOBADRAFT_47008 [Rhodotorula graminis WP1]